MVDILIRRKNHLYCEIVCSQSIAYELREVFSFRPNGYRFMQKFKLGLWDGYIRLFNPYECKLYSGLLPNLIEWAVKKRYTIDIDKTCGKIGEQYPLDGFLERMEFLATMPAYDYQNMAFERLMKANRAICLSPTGSGKSFIQFMLCRYLLEYTDYNILLTTDTTQLVEQLISDFQSYEVESDAMRVSENCHKLYSGKEKETDKRILVSTWQSASKLTKEQLSRYSAYICDEVHRADGESIVKIIDLMQDTAKLRFGLTGTLKKSKCHEMQLRGMFGEVIKTKTTSELMELGNLTSLDINCLIYEYQDEESNKVIRKGKYTKEIEEIITNKNRMDNILKLALTRDNNTLVLFNYVDTHGKPMFERAKELAGDSREVYYISGETSVEEREEIRAKFASQKNMVLFASYGTFSTGINVKNIHYLLLAHPTKSVVRVLQSIGRILRVVDGKNKAVLYDIVDDFSPKLKTKGYLYNHFVERLAIYEEQNFNYNIEKLNIY